jgi:hypothetical protein
MMTTLSHWTKHIFDAVPNQWNPIKIPAKQQQQQQ